MACHEHTTLYTRTINLTLTLILTPILTLILYFDIASDAIYCWRFHIPHTTGTAKTSERCRIVAFSEF